MNKLIRFSVLLFFFVFGFIQLNVEAKSVLISENLLNEKTNIIPIIELTENNEIKINSEFNYSEIINQKIQQNPKSLTINYFFSEGSQNFSYSIGIGKSNLNSKPVFLESGQKPPTRQYSKTYYFYENSFDLIIWMHQITVTETLKHSGTFIVKSINFENNNSQTINVFIEDGVIIEHNMEQLASEFFDVSFRRCGFSIYSADFSGGINTIIPSFESLEENFDLRINFDSIHSDYKSNLVCELSEKYEAFMGKVVLLPIVFDYPFNELTKMYSNNDLINFKLNFHDSINKINCTGILKQYIVEPIENEEEPYLSKMIYASKTGALPQEIDFYVLNEFNYKYKFNVEDFFNMCNETPLKKITLIKEKILPLNQTINAFKKPFKLKLGECNEFKLNYSDYFFENLELIQTKIECNEKTILGLVTDTENKPYSFETKENNGGKVILITPTGEIFESNKGGNNFTLGCNTSTATINIQKTPFCDIGVYYLYWDVKEIFKGSIPATLAKLYFDGTNFHIYEQTHFDLFQIN
jgi:hypothetical protein